jgi:hypothetical protein
MWPAAPGNLPTTHVAAPDGRHMTPATGDHEVTSARDRAVNVPSVAGRLVAIVVLLVLLGLEGQLVRAERAPISGHVVIHLLIAFSMAFVDVLDHVVGALLFEPLAASPIDPCIDSRESVAVLVGPVVVEPLHCLLERAERWIDQLAVVVEGSTLLELGPPQIPQRL